MNTQGYLPETVAFPRAEFAALSAFCYQVLIATGANPETSEAATLAMMHGSRLGVDSHGVRLLNHYVTALEGGRINKAPNLKIVRTFGAIASLDADHAHGALAAYTAMENAVDLARKFGIGAVAIRNTSHFGPAGAYALEAARQGVVGLSACNSDSFVRLHDGAERFHGTNPLAVAVPVEGQKPWLMDMATSAITYNRVQLHLSTGAPLAEDVASTADGVDTSNAALAEMLAPLGGIFGFKGAGLAGLVEILSAVLSGMKVSPEILSMGGPDFSTPREMGAFVLTIAPEAFLPADEFAGGMQRYLEQLRTSKPRAGGEVMAPGDREWREEAHRARSGVPIDPATEAAFRQLATRYEIPLPFENT